MKKNERKFLELQRHWYQKLKDLGFNDIERRDGTLLRLDIRNARMIDRDAVESYYAMARQFNSAHDFDCWVEKTIWELHTEGYSLSEVATRTGLGIKRIRIIIAKHKKTARLS